MDGQLRQSESTAASPESAVTTVLLVEDEDPLRNVIGPMFEGKGFRVLAAASAEAADQLAREYGRTIDVLVTDLSLPGMDGYTLAAKLVGSGAVRRVVYMSGYAEDAQLIRPLGGHSPSYVEKPFRLRSLLETVNQTLQV